MTKTTTITINGRLYDAVTGMPVTAAKASQSQPTTSSAAPVRHIAKAPARTFSDIGPRPTQHHMAAAKPAHAAAATAHVRPAKPAHEHKPAAQSIHARPQKSETLYRKALAKPAAAPGTASFSPTVTVSTRSPMISRFAPSNVTHHPHLNPRPAAPEADPIAPARVHPTVAKIIQHKTAPVEPELSGHALKEQLIKDRLAEVSEPSKPKTRWFARKPRLATILTSTLALLVLGGYITYMNLPIISMKVAASRAGVNATMPGYHPDGYALNGPITYAPGEVNINYKSTTNDNTFKLTQKPSTWDSQAVLDNFVTKESETYLTFQERGIKVFTFGNKAAWVNAGLFYTLDGTATLSSDQVLRIATSM